MKSDQNWEDYVNQDVICIWICVKRRFFNWLLKHLYDSSGYFYTKLNLKIIN